MDGAFGGTVQVANCQALKVELGGRAKLTWRGVWSIMTDDDLSGCSVDLELSVGSANVTLLSHVCLCLFWLYGGYRFLSPNEIPITGPHDEQPNQTLMLMEILPDLKAIRSEAWF